jgi:hypothetical protein
MLFVCHEELLILFLKSNWSEKIRCSFVIALFLGDLVTGICYMNDFIEFNWNMYPRIAFAVITTSFLRNAMKKFLFVVAKSYQAFILYLIVLLVYTCIVHVATAGPLRQDYYNTKENNMFFTYNLSSFGKSALSLYIAQTRANFPDIMLKKWEGNEILMFLIFASYVFLIGWIVINVMVAIFYSNYKARFANVIKGLKNQGYLTRIVGVSMSKSGNINFTVLHKLVEYMNSTDFTHDGMEGRLRAYHVKQNQEYLQDMVELREEARRDKEAEFDEDVANQYFVPYKDRKAGYNQKNKKVFLIFKNSWGYKIAFTVINCYIAIQPLMIIDQEIEYFMFNRYALVELACIFSLADPLLVFIFCGKKQMWQPIYKVEIGTTIIILVMGVLLTHGRLTPHSELTMEQQYPVFFDIYSLFCLLRFSRLFVLLKRSLSQTYAMGNLVINMFPFLKTMVSAVCVIFLIYGQICIQYYGGWINSNTPQAYKAQTGDNLKENYQFLNFNDFPSAIMTLWCIMVSKNWPYIVYLAVESRGDQYGVFWFISFLVVMNIIVMSVIIGLIIDAVMSFLKVKGDKMIKFNFGIMQDAMKEIEEMDELSRHLLFKK